MEGERSTRGEISINGRVVGMAPMPYFGRAGLWLSDELRRGWSWDLPAMRLPLDSRRIALAIESSESDDLLMVIEGSDRGALNRLSGRVAADEGTYSHPILHATLRVMRRAGRLRFEVDGQADIVDPRTCRPPHMLDLGKLGLILFEVWFEIPDSALARHFHCPSMLDAVARYVDRVAAA